MKKPEKRLEYLALAWVAQFPPEANQPQAGVYIMFTVYVLKSSKNGKRYVGYTGKDPSRRLQEHNTGSNKFTSHNGPFTLVYTESFESKTDAISREHFLKSGQGRKQLDNLLG